MGDVMTDLQGRRSVVMGVDGPGRRSIIPAQAPLSELDRYSTKLRSLSQGRGTYTEKFHAYQAVPVELRHRLMAKHKDEEMAV